MFICLIVFLWIYLFFFVLIIMGHPQEVSQNISWRFNLIWLRYLGSKKCLFVSLFVDLIVFFVFINMGHPQEVSLKVLWISDLIWLRYLGSRNIYLFFFLFFLTVYSNQSFLPSIQQFFRSVCFFSALISRIISSFF